MDGDSLVNGIHDDGRCGQDELAVGLALHALEPAEENTARAHLADCPLCQETVRSTEEIAALMGSSVDQHEPPAALRDRLMDAVARTPQISGASVPPAPILLDTRRRRRTPRMLLAAAAAVVLVLGVATTVLGVQVGRLNSQQQAQSLAQAKVQSILADPSLRRAVLDDTAGKPAAVLLSGRNGTAVLPIGLRPNDADQTYALWGLKSGIPVPLAPFDVTSAGSVVEVPDVPADITGLAQFAISREPGRTMPAKPSDVLATGSAA